MTNPKTHAATPQTATAPIFLDAHGVTHTLKIGRSNMYEQIASGDFPAPIKIGRSSRWLASEVQAWAEQKAAARSTAQAGA